MYVIAAGVLLTVFDAFLKGIIQQTEKESLNKGQVEILMTELFTDL